MTTDFTPAQQSASEQDEWDWSPSEEDWQDHLSNSWQDPMEAPGW